MIKIANDGASIVSTNYFSTPQAKAGKFFVSINSSCFRVLLPDPIASSYLNEMRTGCCVEVERNGESLTFWFNDGSESPFRLETNSHGMDRMPSSGDAGRSDLSLAVYIDGPEKVLELPAKYLG